MRVLAMGFLVLCSVGCRTARPVWSVERVNPDTLRHTLQGDVLGGDGRYQSHAWLGIPFAAPPVGALRWKAPAPPAAWATPRASTHFSPVCAQVDNPLAVGVVPDAAGISGSEDCLYLNVWTPRFTQLPRGAQRLPVMVWIHGGGNSIGSAASSELGRLASEQKVVAVSVQYRLGPLGWFRHAALREGAGEDDASGNFGTLDLIAALHWVHDNIDAFGGDPDSVTLFGESAGGEDTYSLLLSPKAKGLFHRAIAQSPVLATASLTDAEHFTDDAEPGQAHSSNETLVELLVHDGAASDRAGAKAHLAAMNAAQVATYLRGKTIDELFGAYTHGSVRAFNMLEMPLVFPDGAVLPASGWLEAFGRPDGWNQVPVLTGSNRDEAKLFLFFDPQFTYQLLGLFPRMRDPERYQAASDVFSRLWRAWAVDAPAQAMVRSGQAQVFSYRFDWAHQPTVLGTDLAVMLGAGHGLEIPFVHGHIDGPLNQIYGEASAQERGELTRAMMGYWAEFARTGRPGRGGSTELPEWPAYDVSSPQAPKLLALDGPPRGIHPEPMVETEDRVVDDAMKDQRFPSVGEKCLALANLVKLRFLSAARFARLTQCQGAPDAR